MKGLILIILSLMFSSLSYSFEDICRAEDRTQWNDCHIFVYLDSEEGGIKDDIYVGEYKDGDLGGKGTWISFDEQGRVAEIYVGEFSEGLPSGTGVLVGLLDGLVEEVYRGEWKDGSKEGYGIEVWVQDNEMYVGELKDDYWNGKGTLYSPEGEQTGIFKDDELILSK